MQINSPCVNAYEDDLVTFFADYLSYFQREDMIHNGLHVLSPVLHNNPVLPCVQGFTYNKPLGPWNEGHDHERHYICQTLQSLALIFF